MLHQECTLVRFATPNLLQHVATRRNRVAKRAQHVAPNNISIRYIEMLRSFSRGLKPVTPRGLEISLKC